jgi:hypothetical protein
VAKQRDHRKKAHQEDLLEGLPPLSLPAAGIDVGSAEHHVAVPAGRDAEPVQMFGSFAADLHRVAQWLKSCRIETVAMQTRLGLQVGYRNYRSLTMHTVALIEKIP